MIPRPSEKDFKSTSQSQTTTPGCCVRCIRRAQVSTYLTPCLHCGLSMMSQGKTPWKVPIAFFRASERSFQVKWALESPWKAVGHPTGLSKGSFLMTSLTVHSVHQSSTKICNRWQYLFILGGHSGLYGASILYVRRGEWKSMICHTFIHWRSQLLFQSEFMPLRESEKAYNCRILL